MIGSATGAPATAGRTIRRIVVALDAVSENRAAIDTAARLAARWRWRLHAVFVEDDDLLRLAVLPFARQVTLGFGPEALTTAHAERQLRAYAERERRELAAAARQHGIEWSFETLRDASGGVGAAAGDFLVAGRSTRPIGGYFRMECRWWTVIEPSPASVLLAHRQWQPRGSVAAVLHDRSPNAERLLEAAAQHAEAAVGRLIVICLPELAAEAGFAAWLSERVADHGVEVAIDPGPLDPESLVRRVAKHDCRLVAVDTGTAATPEHLRDLVARMSCDVLVVR